MNFHSPGRGLPFGGFLKFGKPQKNIYFRLGFSMINYSLFGLPYCRKPPFVVGHVPAVCGTVCYPHSRSCKVESCMWETKATAKSSACFPSKFSPFSRLLANLETLVSNQFIGTNENVKWTRNKHWNVESMKLVLYIYIEMIDILKFNSEKMIKLRTT